MISMIVPLGAIFGSLLGSKFVGEGRRKGLIMLSLITIAGVLITEVKSFLIILLGRMVHGFAAGAFSVICPVFVAEISPLSISGPIGVIHQFMICFGVFVAFLMGNFFIPYKDTPEEATS